MSWDNRVVWSEGLFLRPQHFQQSDRYVEKLLRARTAALRGYGWGFTDLQLNQELLAQGKIAVVRAQGVMEDGTPFSIPDDADPPAPFTVPEQMRNGQVFLSVGRYQPGLVDVDLNQGRDLPLRHIPAEQVLVDTIAGERESATIDVARLNFLLMPEGADRSGFTSLAVARIVEMRADRRVVLDDAHIPPVLDCAAARTLSGWIVEIAALLEHRAEALAARVTPSGARGAAEIADFLLLQALNRNQPFFAHFARTALLHPESLYQAMLQLSGELATFESGSKRAPSFEAYRHEAIAESFVPVIRSIRNSLSMVLEQTALAIPLKPYRYGVHVAEVQDRSLFTGASFVLAVRADVPVERLRREFPAQIKIGPAEKLRELVNVALPGIGVLALPVAPRQIPFQVGTTYFELERKGPLWEELRQSGGLVIHVSGDFPGLDMALWAIREARA